MYGEDSDVFRVRVAGEFPRQENDVFIPLPLVEKSIMTEWTEPTKPARIDIGCDVARYGDDRTVIGYKNFSMLNRVPWSGVNVDIWVKFMHCYRKAACFQQASE